ncbi:uncharacterized protein LOC144763904 [Lissotriton helveticus]
MAHVTYPGLCLGQDLAKSGSTCSRPLQDKAGPPPLASDFRNTNSKDLILLNIEELSRTIKDLDEEIFNLKRDLEPAFDPTIWQTTLEDLNAKLDRYNRELQEGKIRKYRRDTIDYKLNEVYTWAEIYAKRRFIPHKTMTSSEEKELSCTIKDLDEEIFNLKRDLEPAFDPTIWQTTLVDLNAKLDRYNRELQEGKIRNVIDADINSRCGRKRHETATEKEGNKWQLHEANTATLIKHDSGAGIRPSAELGDFKQKATRSRNFQALSPAETFVGETSRRDQRKECMEQAREKTMSSLTVFVLLLFPGGYWASGVLVPEVTGIVGGSLTVHCNYSSRFIGYPQYWCKGSYRFFCRDVVRSMGSGEEVREERYSLKDLHPTLTFTVTMTGLTLKDSGLYWCGTAKKYALDEMFKVTVTVSSADQNVNQLLKSSSTEAGVAATSSSLGTTALSPQWTDHDGISTTPGLSGTTAGDPGDFPPSLDPMVQFWSWLPATLLGILLLAAVSALIIFMNRNKYSGKEDVQMDASISSSTLPPEDILLNTLYTVVGSPAGAKRKLLSSMIKGFPVSAFSDDGYEDMQCLYSETNTSPNPIVSRRRFSAFKTGYGDEEYATIAPRDGDVFYQNLFYHQVFLAKKYGSLV